MFDFALYYNFRWLDVHFRAVSTDVSDYQDAETPSPQNYSLRKKVCLKLQLQMILYIIFLPNTQFIDKEICDLLKLCCYADLHQHERSRIVE